MAGLGGWMDVGMYTCVCVDGCRCGWMGCIHVYGGWLGYGWMDVGMYTCVCVDGWVRWMDGWM